MMNDEKQESEVRIQNNTTESRLYSLLLAPGSWLLLSFIIHHSAFIISTRQLFHHQAT